jgi:hypothetical protein
MGRKTQFPDKFASQWKTDVIDDRDNGSLVDFNSIYYGDWFVAQDGMLYVKTGDDYCFNFATNMPVEPPPGRYRLVDVEIRIVANRE